MRLNHFHFELPDQLIARQPTADRRGSRLLAMDTEGDIQHQNFADILGHINSGDLLVFNNTKVIPARIFGKKETGGSVEILIERITGNKTALAHIRAREFVGVVDGDSSVAELENCANRAAACL